MEPFVFTSPGIACPDRDTLADFDLGRLSECEADEIGEHLSSCDRCQQILEALQSGGSDDPIVSWLRRCLKGPPLPAGPAYAELEARAETALALHDLIASGALTTDFHLDAEELTDRTIGPYRLTGTIGRGGMGIVYLALQVPLKRSVALKMIRAGQAASPQLIARFIREGKAIARLRHPNVVHVYDLDIHRGLPYLAMELVEGGSLQARINADGPLAPRAAAEVVRTVAGAVAHAHREGVIHRDLKPANILLETDGTPKIADFGLAKLLDPDAGAGSVPDDFLTSYETGDGVFLGTASYVAPEQITGGSEAAGPAADVYALGAILYAALTGRAPFVGKSKPLILEQVRTARPESPSKLRPGIPSALEAICLKCLEKSPARRYSSAQALADDLGRWLDDQRPKEIPGPLARLAKRVRRPAAVAAMVALLFVLGWGIFLKASEHEATRIQQEMKQDLAHGRAVTLIQETGKPRWYRWLSGKSTTQAALAPDGTFLVSTWSNALLELVPDTQTDRYRITAQVRHEKSGNSSYGVGLFVACNTYHSGETPYLFFTELVFDGVRGEADMQALFPKGTFPKPPRDNFVALYHDLLFNETAPHPYESMFFGAMGPHFRHLGPYNGVWHNLEVVVTPEGITARWNGQTFTLTAAEIRKQLADQMPHKAKIMPTDLGLPAGFVPEFRPRGGVGLVIDIGSASFRSVRITPL
jgi:serine/threonine-protein kinase